MGNGENPSQSFIVLDTMKMLVAFHKSMTKMQFGKKTFVARDEQSKSPFDDHTQAQIL